MAQTTKTHATPSTRSASSPRSPGAPRFLRFACAIALTSGVGAAAAGCYDSHVVLSTGDAGPRSDARVVADAPVARDSGTDAHIASRDGGRDAGRDAGRDVPLTCSDCDCGWGLDTGPRPDCDSIGLWSCCAFIGPCAPPNLPA